MKPILQGLVDNPAYQAAMLFIALYPVITALFWIEASIVYSFHRERADDAFYQLDEHPFVSVLVAAHNEEAVIGETVNRLLVELLNRHRWKTRIELATAIHDYIELFHNTRRRHSSLGMLSPTEYEDLHANTNEAA